MPRRFAQKPPTTTPPKTAESQRRGEMKLRRSRNPWQCRTCEAICLNMEDLLDHHGSHGMRDWPCPNHPSRKYSHRQALMAHVHKEHDHEQIDVGNKIAIWLVGESKLRARRYNNDANISSKAAAMHAPLPLTNGQSGSHQLSERVFFKDTRSDSVHPTSLPHRTPHVDSII